VPPGRFTARAAGLLAIIGTGGTPMNNIVTVFRLAIVALVIAALVVFGLALAGF
jgi:hypothetical protein